MPCPRCGADHAPTAPCPTAPAPAPPEADAFDAILAGLDQLGAPPPRWRAPAPPEPADPPPPSHEAPSRRRRRPPADAPTPASVTDPSSRADAILADRTAALEARRRAAAAPGARRRSGCLLPAMLLLALGGAFLTYATARNFDFDEDAEVGPAEQAPLEDEPCTGAACEPIDRSFIGGLPFGAETDLARLRQAIGDLSAEVTDVPASEGNPALGVMPPHPARTRVSGTDLVGGNFVDCTYDFDKADGGLRFILCSSEPGYTDRDALETATRHALGTLARRFGAPSNARVPSPSAVSILHDTWTWSANGIALTLHGVWLDIEGSDAVRGMFFVSHGPAAADPVPAEEVP